MNHLMFSIYLHSHITFGIKLSEVSDSLCHILDNSFTFLVISEFEFGLCIQFRCFIFLHAANCNIIVWVSPTFCLLVCGILFVTSSLTLLLINCYRLWTRKEKEIAVVTHSGFLYHALSAFGNDCDPTVKGEICKQ